MANKLLHEDIDHPDLVDQIIAEYLKAADRGGAPPRATWLANHPGQAAELAQFLDDLEQLAPVTGFASTTKLIVEEEADPEHAGLPNSKASAPNEMRNELTVEYEDRRHPNETLDLIARGKRDLATGDFSFQGRVCGEYELLDLLGRGGMGVVFKARHQKLGRTVALKMILAGELASDSVIQRFQAEARAVAQLEHPGIVPLYEFGEHQGLHYFTMGFIDGPTLSKALLDGPLPSRESARMLRDIALAMDYAHRHGVIHRDLKPGNILLDGEQHPKITDFGLAKRIDDASEMTGAGQVLGTPSYMAPEQTLGQSSEVGAAADVYGLGAMLFAMLTGRPPFQASSTWETLRQVVQDVPPQPRHLNSSVPRDLETICLKCLRKQPGHRYESAGDLADDLARFLNGQPIQARPVGVVERALRWYRRRPVVGTMAISLAILLVAVPLLLAGFWREADARADVEAAGRKMEAQAREKEVDARRQTEALERERARQLFQAYVNEAAARRTSPRAGRRFDAIDRIVTARALADDLQLPNEDYVRLRSEAISALSLSDLRGTATGPGWAKRENNLPLFRHVTGADCYVDWDKLTGLLVRRIGDNSIVQRIPDLTPARDWSQISPDNRHVSVLSSGKLVVWQIDGEKPKELARHDKVQFATFTPNRPEVVLLTLQREIVILPLDGKGEPKTLRIPEIQKEPKLRHWHHLASAGGHVAVAGDKRVRIVDLNAGKVMAVCSVPGLVDTMDWSPDGATLAIACMEESIVFFQPASQSRWVVKGPAGGSLWVSFDPTGRYLLSRSVWAGRGTLWDVANGKAELRFSNSELATKGPAYGGPNLADWWQAALDPPHRFITSFLPEDESPVKLGSSAIHPKGRLLANHTTDGIVLGDLATGQRLGFLPAGKGTTLHFDSAGNLFGYINRQLHRWPIVMEGPRCKIGRPERLNLPEMFTNPDISADGRLVAQPTLTGAVVLDRQTGKTTPLQPQQDVRGVAVHPNGSLVASFSWSAKGFRLWEAATGKLIHAHHQGTVWYGQFSPDGKYLITGDSGPDIQLWSVPDCKLVRSLGAHAAFAMSPDSRYIAAAEPAGKIRLNRIDNGELVARFDAPGEDYLADVYFSPDGRYLFGANLERNMIHVWDLWKLRRQLAELKLDWEETPAPEAVAVREPLVVEIAEPQVKKKQPAKTPN
jgi:WD40 repeat protein/tRNA A-37 threonylcarbamoyl transferase component Bud32